MFRIAFGILAICWNIASALGLAAREANADILEELEEEEVGAVRLRDTGVAAGTG